jgi:outer membrane protein assembly factor BamB
VTHDSNWTTEAKWTTNKIKPYFNDFVVFDDHLYGFDGEFLACINLDNGSSKWRARGYGNGQILLLVDQGLLLILTEEGDVALVRAQSDKHEEIARFKAINGKTWNHPVIAHGKLFVRNGETMACFELKGKE